MHLLRKLHFLISFKNLFFFSLLLDPLVAPPPLQLNLLVNSVHFLHHPEHCNHVTSLSSFFSGWQLQLLYFSCTSYLSNYGISWLWERGWGRESSSSSTVVIICTAASLLWTLRIFVISCQWLLYGGTFNTWITPKNPAHFRFSSSWRFWPRGNLRMKTSLLTLSIWMRSSRTQFRTWGEFLQAQVQIIRADMNFRRLMLRLW